MAQLLFSIALAIAVAVITCINSWKYNGEERYKRNNRIAFALLIGAILTQVPIFHNGYNAIKGKAVSDSLYKKKEIENTLAHDSIKILNRQLHSLALEQLDTSKTILKYSQELNQAYRSIAILQGQLKNYFVGDDVIPWITTMPSFDKVTFTILNTGKNPMWNVKMKCKEQQLPDIGVLPTRLVHRYYTVLVPKETKNELFDFVIWYNNGKSVLVDVYISRRPDGFLNQDSVVYSDRNGLRFVHPFIKHKPQGYWNYKTPGYKPDQGY